MAANSALPVVDEQRIGGEGTGPKPPTRNDIGMEERPVLLSNKKGPFSERVRKGLFILVVIVATIVVSIIVYKLTSSDQRENFEGRYNDYAKQVAKAFQDDFERVVAALASLSVEITLYALDTKSTFPFVTVSNFEARGRIVVDIAQGLLVCYAPKVIADNKLEFTNYATNHSGWIEESRKYTPVFNQNSRKLLYVNPSPPAIWEYSPVDGSNIQDQSSGPYAPIWQLAPIPDTTQTPAILMFNEMSDPALNQAINASEATKGASATPIVFPRREFISDLAYVGLPITYVFFPVVSNFTTSAEVAGYVSMQLLWETFLNRYLEPSENGVVVVLQNTCGQAYTYELSAGGISFIGEGDQHDHSFDSLEVTTPVLVEVPSACGYYLRVYPTASFHDAFINKKPAVYAILVAVVAGFLLGMFLIYDYMEQRRRKEELKATVTVLESNNTPLRQRDSPFTQITSSDSSNNTGQDFLVRGDEDSGVIQGLTPKLRIKRYLEANATAQFPSEGETLDGKPIADLFPKTTVLFADIAGFTAWSSEREPSHVFLLLETIYHAFDQLAKRHGVFKVETVRDCYVAVTGVPDPQPDHAIVMAKFACDCMKRMKQLTRRLEVMLGPDTGDLTMRLGIHSGPVTAGVLRGERSRFQLFGDTVHMAERLESTGERGKIQISQDTADLLIAGGMSGMIQGRRELVRTPGKGDMKTFWLNIKVDGPDALDDVDLEPLSIWPKSLPSLDMRKEKMKSMGAKPTKSLPPSKEKKEKSGTIAMIDERRRLLDPEGRQDWGDATLDSRVQNTITQYDKIQRLVDWNVDLLYGHLKAIVANRIAAGNPPQCVKGLEHNIRKDMTVLDEVTEIITLPQFNPNAVASRIDPSVVELEPEVVVQLRDYVTVIASMYRPNPFHNFEHASHVTMSVNKLLARIVTPELGEGALYSPSGIASHRHEYTYGITSDPLTQFAVVFSALIHDVDHPGVSNFQLIKEEAFIATLYRNKSVAEQNSVDLAWDLLMDDSYDALRRCIYSTETELQRFRQVVVNVVLATDIFDQELKALRNNRWDRAFHQRLSASQHGSSDDPDRKATIVIEHIIQASDVAHTMQHWHVYSKWNERLFQEMYANYCSGRSDKNPAEGWYFGEISFFDNYIIPLAEKLKECGVFGVSCDEYLNYAVKNRQEWAVKGEQLVREFEEKCETMAVDHYRTQLS